MSRFQWNENDADEQVAEVLETEGELGFRFGFLWRRVDEVKAQTRETLVKRVPLEGLVVGRRSEQAQEKCRAHFAVISS